MKERPSHRTASFHVTLPQVLFKHFASKHQLPGLSISGTLLENGFKMQKQASGGFYEKVTPRIFEKIHKKTTVIVGFLSKLTSEPELPPSK